MDNHYKKAVAYRLERAVCDPFLKSQEKVKIRITIQIILTRLISQIIKVLSDLETKTEIRSIKDKVHKKTLVRNLKSKAY